MHDVDNRCAVVVVKAFDICDAIYKLHYSEDIKDCHVEKLKHQLLYFGAKQHILLIESDLSLHKYVFYMQKLALYKK